MATLAPQWLALAADRRREVLRRAEALHDTLDPDAAYPLEFIAFRLTGFRRNYGDDSLLIGSAVRPDLRILIDQLSKTLRLPLAADGARTVEQLAADLNVSTKTLSRWRKDGLRWRWVVSAADEAKVRRVIAFTADAVEHYRGVRPDRIARATSFSQLTPSQRDRLIHRARRLAATTDATFNQVAAHLAKRTGRALETIRLILEKHDRDRPDEPLFADRTGPLTARQKRLIGRAHRMGIGVGKLAERFRRSRATIHRVVLDRRAARAMRLRLGHVPNPHFDRPDAGEVYLRQSLDPEKSDSTLVSSAPRSAV
ncbi:MAG: hypothetical protein AAGL98_08215, partial [Planctomycetota bacterium]